MATTIRGYHGGSRDGARWFYLGDAGRDAAGWFGDVHAADIVIVEASTERIEDLDESELYVPGGGLEQDAALYDHLDEHDLDALIIEDFEQGTDAVLISDSAARDMEWVEETE